MPTINYPGVYTQEVPSGARAIQGVSTSVAGFIGEASKGPVNRPRAVRSLGDFKKLYGDLKPAYELGFAVKEFFLNGGRQAWIVRVRRNPFATHYVKGVQAMEKARPLNLLALPGISQPRVIATALAFCKRRKAFLILDTPREAKSPAQIKTWASGAKCPVSSDGAAYYPWLKIADPLNPGKMRLIPPSGTIAGFFAQTDAKRGVWKPPAGTETLSGVMDLDYHLSPQNSGVLNLLGINGLKKLPGSGFVAWGARTLTRGPGAQEEYRYVSVKRLSLFIEESLHRGTKWVAFEPNDAALWARIRMSVNVFLYDLWLQGAFQGAAPEQAYLVKCDSETTTASDIRKGIVNIMIGFAPLKPAEFIIIRIGQKTGG